MPASAESVSLGYAVIEIAPPEGFCALDARQPREADVIRQLRRSQGEQAMVAAQFVACDELEAWCAGERETYERYGQLLLPATGGVVVPTDKTRAQSLADVSDALPVADPDEIESLARQIGGDRSDAGLPASKVLGRWTRTTTPSTSPLLARAARATSPATARVWWL